MSSVLRELRRNADSPESQIWHGVVHSQPTDQGDLLDVIVPDFDPSYVWQGLRWQARGDVALPSPGDLCILVTTNRREPWVIAWWPFS